MTRYHWLALAGLLAFVSCVATAQQPKRDCSLTEQRYDNYWGDGPHAGFIAPRDVHLVVHVGLSAGVGELAHLLFKRGPVVSTAIGAVTIGVLPHARGLLAHRYPLDAPDVAADAMIASVPLIGATAWSAHSWQATVLSATAILASVLAYACGSNP
jgi:hypothetical protein